MTTINHQNFAKGHTGHRLQRAGLLAALCAAVALTACGGDDDDAAAPPAPAPAPAPSPSPSPSPAPLPMASGVDALVGDWLNRKLCTDVGGGRSSYAMMRVVKRDESSVNYQPGVAMYGAANCQGNPTVLVSPLGTVTFSRVESNASVAAHWGRLALITGTASALVWAKLNDNTLCALGDESPTILPSLAQVLQGARVLDQQNACLHKL